MRGEEPVPMLEACLCMRFKLSIVCLLVVSCLPLKKAFLLGIIVEDSQS